MNAVPHIIVLNSACACLLVSTYHKVPFANNIVIEIVAQPRYTAISPAGILTTVLASCCQSLIFINQEEDLSLLKQGNR